MSAQCDGELVKHRATELGVKPTKQAKKKACVSHAMTDAVE